ncbi:hypothetical protein Gilli_0876 [Gillisia limnaea DSM 15749]|uniref:Uncharacterized protein n=1 Tax=Gillisia limnaea (strain DSM 15749 / LMG 21470 / R-8282) TaxID=865937 RepID=H2BTH9_GILLR|nr:hypothetical protein Gilli_0876 [Gillisia limnaea DSM 15749]
MKYIKYLISFLLIFGLTVNECFIYSPINSTNYHQVSYVNTRKEFGHKSSELHTFGRKILSGKAFIAFISYCNLREVYSTQILTILKLRIELYQNINSMIVQHVFLNKIITSSNQYSSLYIA